jgi:hypothetical protein
MESHVSLCMAVQAKEQRITALTNEARHLRQALVCCDAQTLLRTSPHRTTRALPIFVDVVSLGVVFGSKSFYPHAGGRVVGGQRDHAAAAV